MSDWKNPWVLFGLLGQILFFSRWIVQWVASETRKESYVPLSFWVLSLAGGLILLVYAFQRREPVFLVGQAVGVANYARNILLIRKKHVELV
jgi:lipid-A-disaccharide synthase-like uncharacterized protein